MRAGMAFEELRDDVQNLLGHIFEDIVTGIPKAADFGQGEAPLPLGEIIGVKDEIPITPADQHRLCGALLEALAYLFHQGIAGVCGRQRYVLHEPEGRQAVAPAVVGGQESPAHLGSEAFDGGRPGGAARK